ncbi:penicillin-binding protein 1C [Bauldia sp.]|uniref:penicillin-binding protein 1C n=1 Tax=Bauldia sp. TaxID=2575872 RepID=UPI003BAB1A59
MAQAAMKERSRRWRRRLFVGAGVLGLVGLTAAGLVAWLVADIESRLPIPPDPAAVATSTVVLDRNQRLLRPFTIADGRWRLPARQADVDPRFIAMLIGYEDRRFADHHGVDYRALGRAAGQFVAAGGRIVSGGSTLTMQVARLIEEAPTRSASAKLRQILMARTIEHHLDKDAILDLYLMLAPYGGNLEGIRAATLAYFGKEPGRLTVAEAALLVALPQSPEARRPDRFPDAARAARDQVLDRLVATGVVSAEEAQAAKRDRVPTARRFFPMHAAHLADQAVAAAPDAAVHRLTIDRDLQTGLEALARDRVAAVGKRASIAILVADHHTGDVLASVGSAGFLDDARAGHVDMTRAPRSPGSTLKPLIYGLAFEEGLAHPASLIDDRPTGFGGYAPQNFDGDFRGTVTIREALAQSLNIPAVVVLDAVGPARLLARMKRAGITPELPRASATGLAIGLGGVGVSLRDLVGLYAALAAGGEAVPLRSTFGEAQGDGRAAAGSSVLTSSAAWQVADILADVPPPVTGSPDQIAYKTGTSYGYRDAWAIGFDGAHVIGVWIGRPDGTPVSGVSGATTAAPILFEAFGRLGPHRRLLPPAPADVLVANTASLPPPLRRFRHPDAAVVAEDAGPQIAFPQNGVAVDLGIRFGDPEPLAIKVRNGAPPFTFFANGVPLARKPFDRTELWQPDGAGYVTLSVVDASGRSDRVTVFVE